MTVDIDKEREREKDSARVHACVCACVRACVRVCSKFQKQFQNKKLTLPTTPIGPLDYFKIIYSYNPIPIHAALTEVCP